MMIVNKLLMDGNTLTLEGYNSQIEVTSSSTLYILDNASDLSLDITLKDDASLTIYDFNTHNKNSNIIIRQNQNTKFEYNHTFKVSGEYKFNYEAIITGDNNINNINISGVSNGFVSMNVDGQVSKHIKNNELNENIRILTIDGKAYISPMLHVSALNVLANHNTAISNINEDYLFYLMSKGIDRDCATKLIEDSYLYGLFKNEEFINLIK